MNPLSRGIESIARDLVASADGMARSSLVRIADGDHESAVRAHVVAVREYEWAARLWQLIGDHDKERRCLELAESVRNGTWRSIHDQTEAAC